MLVLETLLNPRQSISKVEQARRTFIGNPAQTDQATYERQRAALKQAELEKKVQKAYEKQYQLKPMIAASKNAGQEGCCGRCKEDKQE